MLLILGCNSAEDEASLKPLPLYLIEVTSPLHLQQIWFSRFTRGLVEWPFHFLPEADRACSTSTGHLSTFGKSYFRPWLRAAEQQCHCRNPRGTQASGMVQTVDTGDPALDMAVNLTRDRCADKTPASYLTDRLVKASTRSCTKHKFRISVPGCLSWLPFRREKTAPSRGSQPAATQLLYAGGTPVVQS